MNSPHSLRIRNCAWLRVREHDVDRLVDRAGPHARFAASSSGWSTGDGGDRAPENVLAAISNWPGANVILP